MTKKQRIELYLDSQKAVLNSKNPYYDSHTGKAYTTMAHPRDDDLYIVKEGMFGLTDSENKFIVQLDQLAKDSNRELKIYDIKNFGPSVRAYFKGIVTTLLAIPCGAPMLSVAVCSAVTSADNPEAAAEVVSVAWFPLALMLLVGWFLFGWFGRPTWWRVAVFSTTNPVWIRWR